MVIRLYVVLSRQLTFIPNNSLNTIIIEIANKEYIYMYVILYIYKCIYVYIIQNFSYNELMIN